MSNRDRPPALRRTADSYSNNNNNNSSSSSSGYGGSSANGVRRTSKGYNNTDGAAIYGGNSPSRDHGHGRNDDRKDDRLAVTARSSLLQPRVAVVLGLSKGWYPLLFLCRLLSIVPAAWWGLPSALRLLAMIHLTVFGLGNRSGPGVLAGGHPSMHCDLSFEARLRLLETFLGTLWVPYPVPCPSPRV